MIYKYQNNILILKKLKFYKNTCKIQSKHEKMLVICQFLLMT